MKKTFRSLESEQVGCEGTVPVPVVGLAVEVVLQKRFFVTVVVTIVSSGQLHLPGIVVVTILSKGQSHVGMLVSAHMLAHGLIDRITREIEVSIK